jgi:hypothetical protein
MKHLLFSLLVAGMAFSAVNAQDAPRQYTFSWPIDGANLKPRGGTTKGPPVTVDTEPSAEWRALQASGLTPLERADAIEDKPRKLNRDDQRVITEALRAMGVESGG